jgi:sn-glycerol 3-phosphate transport system permease protein
VASLGLLIALLLAVMANRVIRGAPVYKTLLIWPYAVAPVVAGVLWLMMFASPYGVVAGTCLQQMGYDVEPPAQRQPCHGPDRHGCSLEADLLQLPVLPGGLQSIPRSLIEAADHRRRHALEALLEHRLSAVVADHVLPARHQRGVRVL